MNDVHPTIKFTFKYSPTTIDFLDTSIHLGEQGKTILPGVQQTHWHLPSVRLQVEPSSRNKIINYLLTST